MMSSAISQRMAVDIRNPDGGVGRDGRFRAFLSCLRDERMVS